MINTLFGDSRLPQAFWDFVQPNIYTGCWLWAGKLDPNGYARVHIPGMHYRLAHRAVFRALKEDFGAGSMVDQTCGEHSCVNPDHLEKVSSQQKHNRERWRGNTPVEMDHPFTPREFEVLELLSYGYDGTQIAAMLGSNRNTIKSKLASMYYKTDTSGQVALIAHSFRQGWID